MSRNPELACRERVLTEKGREYQCAQSETHLSALSAWRKQANKKSVLLTDCKNTDVLRSERDVFQSRFETMESKFKHLKNFKPESSSETESFEKNKSVI